MKKNIWIVVVIVLLMVSTALAEEVKVEGAGQSVPANVKLNCANWDCWSNNPKGNYFEVGKLEEAVVKGNINQPLYPANSVSAKQEKEAGVWGYLVVVRNPMTTPRDLLTPGLCREIQKHWGEIPPLKLNQEGEDGDSCFEKTWVVREDGTWFFLK